MLGDTLSRQKEHAYAINPLGLLYR
jgi:hypothetical protein